MKYYAVIKMSQIFFVDKEKYSWYIAITGYKMVCYFTLFLFKNVYTYE